MSQQRTSATNDRWATVSTVKEPLDRVCFFVAHHKSLGADEIHLYFDDPDDPAASVVEKVPGVIVTRCDDAYWRGTRPEKHQDRQVHNANAASRRTAAEWIIHLDGDEAVYAPTAPSSLLSQVSEEISVVRLRPAEAMTVHWKDKVEVFRYALPDTPRGHRIGAAVYGDVYPILNHGLLSHTAGKHFVRTSVENAGMTIHGPRIGGRRETGQTSSEMTLLHWHGADEDEWLDHFERRMEVGAYQACFHDDRRRTGSVEGMGRNAYLAKLASTEGEAGLRRFYRQVCVFDQDKRPLRRTGALLKLRMWREEKLETWFPNGRHVAARNLRMGRKTGSLEADVEMRGLRLVAALENNYTEVSLASGFEPEADEFDTLVDLVGGRRVTFWDIGANAGVYSLLCASVAGPGSIIHAFEPNPVMVGRLRRNIAINDIDGIVIHEVALGPRRGHSRLRHNGELGQATILPGRQGESGAEVRQAPLTDYVDKEREGELRVLKIDIEGAEPLVLQPFFSESPQADWPDVILYEHAHTDQWQCRPEELFPDGAYEPSVVFRNNTLLMRMERS